jgi:hypothetical protein
MATREGIVAVIVTLLGGTALAHASGPTEETHEALGWTAGGHLVTWSTGIAAVTSLWRHEPEAREICSGEQGCGDSAAKARSLPRVRRLALVPGSGPPPGYATQVTRYRSQLQFLVTTPLGRQVLGTRPTPTCEPCTYRWTLLGTTWEPQGRAVAFRIRELTHYEGYDGDSKATRYVVLPLKDRQRGPGPRRGITEAFLRLGAGPRAPWVRIRTDSTLFAATATRHGPRTLWAPPGAWCEGAPGDGRGQKIVLTFQPATRVAGLRVRPGHQGSAALLGAHGRPTALRILTSNRTEWRAALPAGQPEVTISLPRGPETVRYLVIQIKTARPGRGAQATQTCLSLLRPF